MKTLIVAVALSLAALAAAVPSAQAEGSATAAQFDCSDNQDGNYPDPNDSSGYIACVAQTEAYAMPCATSHDGTRLFYLANSGPDPVTSRCDYPSITSEHPELTTGTLRTPGVPGTVTALTASLTNFDQPVEAARITFRDSYGKLLCEKYTGNQGTATCNTLPANSTTSFTATFAGGSANPAQDGGWQAAEATGTIS
ncbi:carbohydrate-binding module family 14 protein [Streptomyces sp. NPDC051546]|uniref:carbohydrate-binding module family 14 protein n=1 Tax=Streptomyces sp. NPDC051546 TaxID=3365655 RepID=UPI0037B5F6D4